MAQSTDKKLSIVALGGVFEIGKNMYAVQYGDDIVVIDCGSKFPDESLLGIDLIIPDVSYLLEHKEQIRGLIITHGHEDHIGGIPYVLKQLNMPVYATRLTLGIINTKLQEHKIDETVVLYEIDAESHIQLGSLELSFSALITASPIASASSSIRRAEPWYIPAISSSIFRRPTSNLRIFTKWRASAKKG